MKIIIFDCYLFVKQNKMDIDKYLGIENSATKIYTVDEFNDILTGHKNLDRKQFYMVGRFFNLLQEYKSVPVTIKFLDMFKDIGELAPLGHSTYHCSVAVIIIRQIQHMDIYDKIYVYKIMDHILKKNVDMTILGSRTDGNDTIIYGINDYCDYNYGNIDNNNVVKDITSNYDTIQNVRKLINNYDILLFNITDDLSFIKQILLISKSIHKNLPKCIIIFKILYYYLLNKNENNNI